MSKSDGANWQVVSVNDIGFDELWFDKVKDGLSQREAERRAKNNERHIAIPEPDEMPDDWGEQFLNGELESDPYA